MSTSTKYPKLDLNIILEDVKQDINKVSWKSPSNIAFIKYWGKRDVQIPMNPSLSMTLKDCTTTTQMEWLPRTDFSGPHVEFYFENKVNEKFKEKVQKYLNGLLEELPFLRQFDLLFKSENSFPHSAGIASSASGMSAIALCLTSFEQKLFGTLDDSTEFFSKASHLARLGSGSACRSLFPKMSVWGENEFTEGENNKGVEFSSFHEKFEDLQDSILIVHSGEKEVSSRVGHSLMNEHPYAEKRFSEANKNLSLLLDYLKDGDIFKFGEIVEREAMDLHGLMMTSRPSFLLMKPNTLLIIERIKKYRLDKKIPLFFTLDAGPNVHVIYPKAYSPEVKTFIRENLLSLCEDGKWFEDSMGNGPEILG